MSDIQIRRRSVSRIALVLIVVLTLGLGVGVIWWLTGGLQARQDRPLKNLLSYAEQIDPREMTDEVCTESRGLCLEGWRTDVGDFQRFGSIGEAEYWATVLGDDGRRNGAVVLNMAGLDLSLADKRQAIDVLFSDRDWN